MRGYIFRFLIVDDDYIPLDIDITNKTVNFELITVISFTNVVFDSIHIVKMQIQN